MVLRRTCSILASIFLLASCSKEAGVVLHVDLGALRNEESSFFDYFDKVEIIPLDDAYQLSNGQYSEPQYLAVTDSFIFVLDEKSMRLVSFDADGKFIREVARRGNAGNEYTLAYGIQADKEGQVRLLDPRGSIYTYNSAGRFVGRERIEGMLAVHKFIEGDWGTLLFTSSAENPLCVWRDGEAQPIRYSPAFDLKKQFNAAFPFVTIDGEVCYYEGLTGKIYTIDFEKGKTSVKYSWDFGRWNADLTKTTGAQYDFLKSLQNEFYDSVFPFLNILSVDGILIADVLFQGREHTIIVEPASGAACCIDTFSEGIRLKVSTERDGVLYQIVEPESLPEFINPKVLDQENRMKYEAVIAGSQSNPVLLKYHGFPARFFHRIR